MKISVERYMTATPHQLGPQDTLADALALMNKHSIRHLPVVENEALCGLVSHRDLSTVEALSSVDPNLLLIKDIMTPDVYQVNPHTWLKEVVAEMIEAKVSSAVVTDNGKVVGVFTTIDALVALTDLLNDF